MSEVTSRSSNARGSSLSPSKFDAEKRPDASTESGTEGVEIESSLEGGRDAWKTVIGTWLIQFCTYGYISAFGVYQDYYTRTFLSEYSASDISWIGSFQLFMQYGPGLLVGIAFDAGYFRLMMTLGTLLQVVSMLMLSLSRRQKYYQVFLTQAFGMGLGQSLLFLPSLTIIGQHYQRRRALATGIAVSGASFGGVAWPIILNTLIARLGFANAVRVTGGMVAALLITANAIMKTKHSDERKEVNICWMKLKTILQDSAYLLSVASAFSINLGLFFPYFYLQLFSIDKGISSGLAFYSITLLNAGSVLGRIFPNFFADRCGVYNILLPCLFISSALAFSMFAITNFTGMAVFGVLYGFWSGSYVSLIPSLLVQLSLHAGEHGTRMGIAFSIVGISLLVGAPLEGGLLRGESGTNYTWYRSIIFCGAAVLIGAVGMTISRHLFIQQNRGHPGRFRRV